MCVCMCVCVFSICCDVPYYSGAERGEVMYLASCSSC